MQDTRPPRRGKSTEAPFAGRSPRPLDQGRDPPGRGDSSEDYGPRRSPPDPRQLTLPGVPVPLRVELTERACGLRWTPELRSVLALLVEGGLRLRETTVEALPEALLALSRAYLDLGKGLTGGDRRSATCAARGLRAAVRANAVEVDEPSPGGFSGLANNAPQVLPSCSVLSTHIKGQ